MKRFQVGLTVMSAFLSASAAFAAADLQKLSQDTYDLNNIVLTSTLDTTTKDAVSSFAEAVNALVDCTANNPDTGTENCTNEVQAIGDSWATVDQDLSGTEATFPDVYQQYTVTGATLNDYLSSINITPPPSGPTIDPIHGNQGVDPTPGGPTITPVHGNPGGDPTPGGPTVNPANPGGDPTPGDTGLNPVTGDPGFQE